MYNIKGPSKIVAKTRRRGMPQNMDNFRDSNRNKSVESDHCIISNVPKPIFHKKSQFSNNKHDVISPQHEEIIQFITESWNSVCTDLNRINSDPATSYYEGARADSLSEFKPFDLESWWGKRLYAYITTSVNMKN